MLGIAIPYEISAVEVGKRLFFFLLRAIYESAAIAMEMEAEVGMD